MINQKLNDRMPEIIEILHSVFDVRCETCISFEKFNSGAYYGKCKSCGQTMALCHYCDRYERQKETDGKENE